MKRLLPFFLCTFALTACVQQIEPCGPVPTENQLRWQDMEMYAFIHYSLNTYTDQEWGYGNESLELFNPSDLDCRQWARVCKQAGMKGIIFTAKHHCGFCMWPSKYTEYSVKNTPWKNGQGEFSNIVNNPIWQTISFDPVETSMIRLEAVELSSGERVAYEDLEVIRCQE